jgi:UDP-N-acetylglucosamine 2-epimerase (non-hydrolysing)
MAAILQVLCEHPAFSPRLIHTGQHYSPEMSRSFFEDLGLREPDINLSCAGGTQITQLADIMLRLEPVFAANLPALLLVVGDVTSTLAAALVASKMNIRIAHVEAGLRSFDRRMPEEINRVLTDHISDFLFATEQSGVDNLNAEGIPAERVHLAGNVMIDTLLRHHARALQTDVLDRLSLVPQTYAVATLHRPSNVDCEDELRALIGALRTISVRCPVVFPIHPRTAARLAAAGISTEGMLLTPPLGYLDFMHLVSEARLVLTDSGGIQEETTILRVPCLTLRENTERPATITNGSNRLVGVCPDAVVSAAWEVLERPARSEKIPDLWDGHASARIVDILARTLS